MDAIKFLNQELSWDSLDKKLKDCEDEKVIDGMYNKDQYFLNFVIKSIEEKINKGDINSNGYNRTSIADPVIQPENTGPGGFKVNGPSKNIETSIELDVPIKREKSGNNYIYNAIFNISILLIIGIAIILLCDQIVELSIQIGMKRVVNILEPFIKTPVQELVNN